MHPRYHGFATKGESMTMAVHTERIHIVQEEKGLAGARADRSADHGSGPVVYWMSRDQRMRDNWALLYAQQLAREQDAPLAVVFCLVPKYLGAAWRAYEFMIGGLRQVEADLVAKRTPFFLLQGEPVQELPAFVARHQVQTLVCEFSPLRLVRRWQERVAARLKIAMHEVDAHNVMPCRTISDKQEYAARTIRPKLQRRLQEFLPGFPRVQPPPQSWPQDAPRNDWETALKMVSARTGLPPMTWLKSGERAARRVLRQFLANRLKHYDAGRNDPNADALSQLSPYLHFGQISAQRVALEVLKAKSDRDSQEVFLEELIVRRELSDNFCHHNPDYDRYEGFPAWARRTLEDHANDPREHLYSRSDFDQARTHDPLWNAAQQEMVLTGKMHGYLRMYWAKKILEWTEDPETALGIANHLNDAYELDGRDPNGYTGTAWSIGGVHDRPWFERPVFGKIRYMSASGCQRKFDVARYIERMQGLAREAKA